MMTLDQVQAHLAEAAALGVREYYFTGGEPFLNRELFEMMEAALRQGPVSVLTNGVLIRAGDRASACGGWPTRASTASTSASPSTAGTRPPTMPSAARARSTASWPRWRISPPPG